MTMTAYCQARVSAHLEEVMEFGATKISKSSLLYWFNQARESKTIWRDISALWDEMIENSKAVRQSYVPLFIADNTEYNASYTMIWGEGLEKSNLHSSVWFKDIKGWM